MKPIKLKAAPSKLPAKRSINLAVVGEKKFNIPAAFSGTLLIILLASAFSKFFVLDRFAELQRYEAEVLQLQFQVEQCHRRVQELVGVENEYAHYTLENMTEEELTRCDRNAIVKMMREKVLGEHGAISWSVNSNNLTMEITGSTLQEINLLCKEIEKSPIVDFCTVSKAEKGFNTRRVNSDGSVTYLEDEIVTAIINAYLKV